jgi:hypothetical protein
MAVQPVGDLRNFYVRLQGIKIAGYAPTFTHPIDIAA